MKEAKETLVNEGDLLSGRDFGKTGDYILVNMRGDQFPAEHSVPLRSMARKALSMKFRIQEDYAVIEARSTRLVYSTHGKDPIEDPGSDPSQIIGPSGAIGREILKQARGIFPGKSPGKSPGKR